jgi:hypothetical protein
MVNSPGDDALDRYGVPAPVAGDPRKTQDRRPHNGETPDRRYVADRRREWTDIGDTVQEASSRAIGMTWRPSGFFESEGQSR